MFCCPKKLSILFCAVFCAACGPVVRRVRYACGPAPIVLTLPSHTNGAALTVRSQSSERATYILCVCACVHVCRAYPMQCIKSALQSASSLQRIVDYVAVIVHVCVCTECEHCAVLSTQSMSSLQV